MQYRHLRISKSSKVGIRTAERRKVNINLIECKAYDVTFVFCGTGRRFVKDGKTYKIEGSGLQSEQAFKSGLSFRGKPAPFKLTDIWGWPIPEEQLYRPYFGPRCQNCGMRLTCNGCSRCGRCEEADQRRAAW